MSIAKIEDSRFWPVHRPRSHRSVSSVRLLAALGSIMILLAMSCTRPRESSPSAASSSPSTTSLIVGSASTTGTTGSEGSATPPTTTAPTTAAPTTAAPTTAAPPTTVRAAVAAAGKTTDGSVRMPDGRDRTFRVYTPSTLKPGDAVPLLIGLHGGIVWGSQFEANSGFDGLAEANRFIVVYPDGIGAAGTNTFRTWNGGYCCGPAAKEGVDDVAFISKLIDDLRASFTIDGRRVYAGGHSNGGILAYRLACELSDKIVAVGLQASSLGVDRCEPSKPLSLIHIHGTADNNHPIGGGKGSQGISGVVFRPAIDGVTTVARADGCGANPATTVSPTNRDVTTEVWQQCRDGTAVEFVKVAGASHAWMGHPGVAARLVGETYMNYDSSLAIWTFLAAHPRP